MGFLSSLGGIGGAIMTGLGIATSNPALIGAGLATTGVSGVLASNEAQKTANKLYSKAGSAADTQAAIALDQWNRYKEIYDPLERERAKSGLEDVKLYEKYRPLEEKFYQEAQQGYTPEELSREALANIEKSYANQEGILARKLGRFGLSGSLASALRDMSRDEALAKAQAKTKAYLQAKELNFNRLGSALNVRKGLSPYTPVPGTSSIVGSLGTASNTMANLARIASGSAGAGYTSGIQLGLMGLNQLSPYLSGLFSTSPSSSAIGFTNMMADTALLPSTGIEFLDSSGTGLSTLSSYSLPIPTL